MVGYLMENCDAIRPSGPAEYRHIVNSQVSMRNPLLPFFAQVSNAYAFESNCCSQCHIGTKCTHNGGFVSRTQLYECITSKGGHYNR